MSELIASILYAAQSLPETERARYLEIACKYDEALRARIEQLLALEQDASEFLESFLLDPDATPELGPRPNAFAAEQAGHHLGRYKLLEKIGEGGFGSVWMAEQREPVRRRVAVKVIKLGMDTKQVIARFEAERQALAMMDHPNIAKVLDAGATDAGRPYFVMEYIRGVPILEYCDTAKLNPDERLKLFIPVCHAVHHAHQKGIIHRDLKPTNVLVTLHDGVPVPKVIDFGIAKATNSELTNKTLFTNHGQMIGTPAYMSPEQAEMSGLDIDTRSDIYSLGVLLYELLTGTTPFDNRSLLEAGFERMMQIIREVEPPKPSTRLSSLGKTASRTAEQRQTDVTRLSSTLRGDLDWIVMKCLEKDRTRRYDSVTGLAADIVRYLSDEPVEAGPPSRSYKLKKFARRNKAAVIAASLVLSTLLAGLAGTAYGLIRAEQEKTKAVAANELAHKRLAQLEKGNEILTSIFTDFDIRRAKEGYEPLEAILAKRLVHAAEQLEGEAVGDPLAVARLQARLGLSLLSLGYANDAIDLLSKVREVYTVELGADHRDTLTALHNLALAHQQAGNVDLAVPLFEESLRRSEETLGADHVDTLKTMSNLACAYQAQGKLERALPLHEEALVRTRAKYGTDHPESFAKLNNLAVAYSAAGKLELALELAEEVWQRTKTEFGADHADTLQCMVNLADLHRRIGKVALALTEFEEALRMMEVSLGANHPDTLDCMGRLAVTYQTAGNINLALPLLEKTLELKKERLGYDHPKTLATMNDLAWAYAAAGQIDFALPLAEKTLRLRQKKLGNDHTDTLVTMYSLALSYLEAEMPNKALPLFGETLALQQEKVGDAHPSTLLTRNNLALAYMDTGQLPIALPLLEETLTLAKENLGNENPITLITMHNLAMAYKAADKLEQAAKIYEMNLESSKKVYGITHPNTRTSMINLTNTFLATGRTAEAAELAKTLSGIVLDQPLPDSHQRPNALATVGGLLIRTESFEEAEVVCRECLTIHEKTMPDSWSHFAAQSRLGCAFLGQKKYDEAEPLLLSGYEGMKARNATMPASAKFRLTESLECLVELYAAVAKPDEVEKWKAELEQHETASRVPDTE
jgi:serine/threonine protein kinase